MSWGGGAGRLPENTKLDCIVDGEALDYGVEDGVLAYIVGCGAHVHSVGGVAGRRNGVQ